MPHRAVVVVTSRRRDPPELMLLALCLLAAVSYLAGAEPPSSVEAVMPAWLVTGWYASLAAAGVIGVVGNLWPGALLTAWRVRLAGQVIAAGPAAAYAVAAYAYAGSRALMAGSLVVAWALICAWQAALLARDVRRLGGAR